MGWTGVSTYGTGFNKKAHLDSLWDNDTLDNGEKKFEVLDHLVYGSTHYQAIKNNAENKTFAVITLTQMDNREGWFYYKEMSENMGSFEYKGITKKFLNLLSPTDNKYASEWRNKAEAQIERDSFMRKNLVDGSIIEFNTPITYQTLGDVMGGEVVKMRNRNVLKVDGIYAQLPHGWKDKVVAVNGVAAPEIVSPM